MSTCSRSQDLVNLPTGKFPPTPKLQSASKAPMAAKFGEEAAIRPKIEVIPMVKLKASRRPNISQPKPQKIAPNSSPMFCARVSKGGLEGLNSRETGFKMREVTIGQRLSEAQPNPTTTNNCHWYHPIPISWIALFNTRALFS